MRSSKLFQSKILRTIYNNQVLEDLQVDHSETNQEDEHGLSHGFCSSMLISKDQKAICFLYGAQVNPHLKPSLPSEDMLPVPAIKRVF